MARYSRAEVELALGQNGVTKVQEDDGIAIYQKNTYPGCEVVIVWDNPSGVIELDDLRRQLNDADAPTDSICDDLARNRNRN